MEKGILTERQRVLMGIGLENYISAFERFSADGIVPFSVFYVSKQRFSTNPIVYDDFSGRVVEDSEEFKITDYPVIESMDLPIKLDEDTKAEASKIGRYVNPIDGKVMVDGKLTDSSKKHMVGDIPVLVKVREMIRVHDGKKVTALHLDIIDEDAVGLVNFSQTLYISDGKRHSQRFYDEIFSALTPVQMEYRLKQRCTHLTKYLNI